MNRRLFLSSIAAAALAANPNSTAAQPSIPPVRPRRLSPLGVPAWFGAMIGHQMQQWTVPVGAEVQIDSSKGTITLPSAAVE
jgi:muramoyltetrapeptide carboxypeptidase LdcA involved in peptidoglycan recycling